MSMITSGYGGPSSAALSQMRQQMFSRLDADSSGGIDEAEFAQGLSSSSELSEAKLKEAFATFDADGDGSLTQGELSTGFQKLGGAVRTALLGEQDVGPRGPGGGRGGPGGAGGPPSPEELFAKLDTDESGGVDEAEFVAGAPEDGRGPSEAELKELFASFDADGDGALTAAELQSGFESHRPGAAQGAGEGGPGGAGAPPPPPPQGKAASDETENPFLSLLASSGGSGINKADLASLLASFAKLTQSGQVQGLSATA